MSGETLDELALRFALENAIEHDGEANKGAVIGRVMAYDDRFKDDAQRVAQVAGRVVADVNGLDEAEQAKRLEDLGRIELEAKDEHREGLPELPGTEDVGEIVMRFAPNPNGPPSLGHSRGMCINGAYAEEHDATLLLRFDDTDPVNKAPWEPAYEMFEAAFEWLEIPIEQTLYASDRMGVYYEHARKALEEGAAYTCECPPDTFREHKQALEACPHRGDPLEEQLDRWEAMLEGSFATGECVLRIKTDMQHPDPALRDWVGFRIVDIERHPHARAGTDYHVWPLLDFQSAIDDHLLGVTHVIRGKDLADSERKQRFLYDHFGWDYPEVLHWGRVGVHGFGAFSTSAMREEIEKGTYSGWDDPRLPTLQALRRRGFLPEAIMNFWSELGLTEKDIEVSVETLEAENRKLLDEHADRLFFVKDPVKVNLKGAPESAVADVPRHPDDPSRGTRRLPLQDPVLLSGETWEALDEEEVFRLKDGADVEKVGSNEVVWVSRELSHQRDGPIVEWTPAPGVPCSVLRPDASWEEGRVEPTALEEDEGTIVQFERYGFSRLETVEEEGIQAVFGHR